MSLGNEDKELCGVGLRITESAPFRVRECVAGAPTYESGRIRAGDTLVSVDGAPISHRPIYEVRAMISGRPGTMVHLRFRRMKSQPMIGGHAATQHAERSDNAADDSHVVFDVSLIRRRAPAAASAASTVSITASRRVSTPIKAGEPPRAATRSSWAAGNAQLCRDLPPAAAATAAVLDTDSDASR